MTPTSLVSSYAVFMLKMIDQLFADPGSNGTSFFDGTNGIWTVPLNGVYWVSNFLR